MRSRFLVILLLSFLVGCSFQAGYNPTYVPDEEPEYISADEVLLLMPDEVEDFVYSGSPKSFSGSGTNLTIPIGVVLKEVAVEILEDRFSGRVQFSSEFEADRGYKLALAPSVRRFEYYYNQLKNIGFAITPEVEVDLKIQILDAEGAPIFDEIYESGRVSGDTYMISGSPSEKINKTLHKTIYDLLVQSFADARPIVLEHLNIKERDGG